MAQVGRTRTEDRDTMRGLGVVHYNCGNNEIASA